MTNRLGRRHPRARGFTLIELVIAISIMSMLSLLIYGAFSGMKTTREGLERISDRYREGRLAMSRITRDLQSAYISQHLPLDQNLAVVKTAFSATTGTPADRLDFNSFSNVRRDANSHVSDQAEISFFGSENPELPGVTDLVRRISEYPDNDPKRGGRVEVVATNIDLFKLEFLDAQTGTWLETWDTTQATGQPNRLPLQARVTLVLRDGRRSSGSTDRSLVHFRTQVPIAISNPLAFAVQ